ncbi:type II toxin-antitoxin system VapC family toxin [Gloeobacter morelensis]|uniref:Ribonuclease VapC n=1 Tax=Gloeobacter morelensis MG652769 TaxID=2781736 RepID=A0ABY3PTC3_9CYAN|nr:type II toxin-antitoxin system VapC family toxin [Gloeobacter morelensis]UFP96738.1 type II toxin-antitoxin system VapC family toxin [Gloeobacter morelensis MG652769]
MRERRFLLDTNVVSEFVRLCPEPLVVNWLASQNPLELFLSATTFGELADGVYRLDVGKKRDTLLAWLEELPSQFSDRILPFDRTTSTLWGRLMAQGDRRGRPRPAIDLQIAATAIQHGLVLATRNIDDFRDLDLSLVNPWEPIS